MGIAWSPSFLVRLSVHASNDSLGKTRARHTPLFGTLPTTTQITKFLSTMFFWIFSSSSLALLLLTTPVVCGNSSDRWTSSSSKVHYHRGAGRRLSLAEIAGYEPGTVVTDAVRFCCCASFFGFTQTHCLTIYTTTHTHTHTHIHTHTHTHTCIQ